VKGALLAVGVESRLRDFRQEVVPSCLEISARSLKAFSGSIPLLAGLKARIKPA
jgi:hypothetical protein